MEERKEGREEGQGTRDKGSAKREEREYYG